VKLLLDTHIWLWSLAEPGRLARRVARELEDPENEIWISPISTWEVLMLCRNGRIVLSNDPAVWIAEALRRVGLREAALNHDVALRSAAINLPHADPADRFIAATALAYDLVLVTADERLLAWRGLPTLANR
jgi:PIN domain nuclease of toxin-antitoxin system